MNEKQTTTTASAQPGNVPSVGNLINVRGTVCRITALLDFGTLECETLDGTKAYRVSGLYFHYTPATQYNASVIQDSTPIF